LTRAVKFDGAPKSLSAYNALHGHLLLLRHLIADVMEWQNVGAKDKVRIEGVILELLRYASDKRCPPVMKILLECIMAFDEASKSIATSTGLIEAAVSFAEQTIRYKHHPTQPGYHLLLDTCAAFLMDHRPAANTFLNLLSVSSGEDQQIAVLEALSTTSNMLTLPVLERVCALVTSRSRSDSVRIAASQALVDASWDDAVLGSIDVAKRNLIYRQLSKILKQTTCVPLREAVLPALGWTTAWVSDSESSEIHLMRQQCLIGETDRATNDGAFADLAESLQHASHEEQVSSLRGVLHCGH